MPLRHNFRTKIGSTRRRGSVLVTFLRLPRVCVLHCIYRIFVFFWGGEGRGAAHKTTDYQWICIYNKNNRIQIKTSHHEAILNSWKCEMLQDYKEETKKLQMITRRRLYNSCTMLKHYNLLASVPLIPSNLSVDYSWRDTQPKWDKKKVEQDESGTGSLYYVYLRSTTI